MRLRSTMPEARRRERLPGHYGESLVVTWRGHDYALGAGASDWTYYYRDLDDRDALYCLTWNYGLGYVGLEYLSAEHALSHPDKPEYLEPESVFFQAPNDDWSGLGEVLPRPLSDYWEPNQVRILSEYLPY